MKAQRRLRKSEWVIFLAPLLILLTLWLGTGGRTVWRRFVPPTLVTTGYHPLDLEFSPDGQLLAVESQGTPAKPGYHLEVWDTANLMRRWEAQAHLGSFSPDGKRLAADDGRIVFESVTGRSLPVPREGVRCWADSRGSNVPWLTVRQWSIGHEKVLQSKNRMRSIDTVLRRFVHPSPSPSGRYTVGVIQHDRTVWHGTLKQMDRLWNRIEGPAQVWDSQSGRVLAQVGGRQVGQALFADENTLVLSEGPECAHSQRDVHLTWWDWRRRRRLRSVQVGPTYRFRIAPARRYLLCCRYIGKTDAQGNFSLDYSLLDAFDLRTGQSLWRYQAEGSIDEEGLGFSRDASRICLAEGGSQYSGVLLDAANGKPLARFPDSRYVAISQDGKRLATTNSGPYTYSSPGRVTLHDVAYLRP